MQSPWEGPIAAQLVHSRDGLTWHRFADRSPVIARGPARQLRRRLHPLLGDRPLVHGDEVWPYYTGINTMHGGPLPGYGADDCAPLRADAVRHGVTWARATASRPSGRYGCASACATPI